MENLYKINIATKQFHHDYITKMVKTEAVTKCEW